HRKYQWRGMRMDRIDLMSVTQPALQPSADVGKKEGDLKRVAQEFESLLIHQMLKNMRATVPESPMTSHGERIFRDMLDLEYARQMALAGGIGLADIIIESLTANKNQAGVTGIGG